MADKPSDESLLAEDILQPFFFEDLPVRGALVRLSASLGELLSAHAYPAPVASLLGQAAVASSLIANSLKFNGRLTLQLGGGAVVSMLVMQSRDNLNLRGMAMVSDDVSPVELPESFAALTEGARLSASIASNNARERYQGIIEVNGETLAETLEHFFEQSVQVPTRLLLWSDGTCASGMVLQVVAGSDDFAASDDWRRLGIVMGTLSPADYLSNTAFDLIRKVFAEDDLRLPNARPVRFHCECSREKAANAVSLLGQSDAELAVAEQGELTVTCEYCATSHQFDAVDVRAIFALTAPAVPQQH